MQPIKQRLEVSRHFLQRIMKKRHIASAKKSRWPAKGPGILQDHNAEVPLHFDQSVAGSEQQ
jgi:hypothetical protein